MNERIDGRPEGRERGHVDGTCFDSSRAGLREVQRLFGLIAQQREQGHPSATRMFQRRGARARDKEVAGCDHVAEIGVEGAPAGASGPWLGDAVEADARACERILETRRQIVVAKMWVEVDRGKPIPRGQPESAANRRARPPRRRDQGREAKQVRSVVYTEPIFGGERVDDPAEGAGVDRLQRPAEGAARPAR